MVGRTLDWQDELERWLKPFLDRLGHTAPDVSALRVGKGANKSDPAEGVANVAVEPER